MSRTVSPSFTVSPASHPSRARLGTLRTPHGTIATPAYVIVATHAAIRTLVPSDIVATQTQVVIANTYHLWKSSRVHRKLGVRLPMMTDSGGFQVFSLGAAREQGVGKVLKRNEQSKIKSDAFTSAVTITEKGVRFLVEGEKRFLSPEISMAIQERLGADIIFAFDECTSPLHSFAHTTRAMERTHRWARRCLRAHTKKNQMLYGIVQGGRFASLRRASAKTIGAMAFDGFGIGGSYGKDEMAQTLHWVIPHLPDEKPRHLLGIGSVQDIFVAVESGVDTMDCVIPTREARHARLYTDSGIIDVRKAATTANRRRLLGSSTTFAQLHALFKAHNQEAGRLATLHNVTWFNRLLKRIRTALADGTYEELKHTTLIPYAR